jgi:hypothetical protein
MVGVACAPLATVVLVGLGAIQVGVAKRVALGVAAPAEGVNWLPGCPKVLAVRVAVAVAAAERVGVTQKVGVAAEGPG